MMITDDLTVEALVPELCDVIEQKYEITFVYAGQRHVMHPHVLFRDGPKTCLGGLSDHFAGPMSFDVAEMLSIEWTGGTFEPDQRLRYPRGEGVTIVRSV